MRRGLKEAISFCVATSNMETLPASQTAKPPLTRQVSAEQTRRVVHVAHDRRHDVGLVADGGNREEHAAFYPSHVVSALTTLHVVTLHAPARARRKQPPTELLARAVVVEQAPHGVGVVVDHAHPTPHATPHPLRLARHRVEQSVAVPGLLVHLSHRAVHEHRRRAGGLHAVQLDRPVGASGRHGVHGGQPGGGERGRGLRGVDDLRGRGVDAESVGERQGEGVLRVGCVPNANDPQFIDGQERSVGGGGELDAADGREVAMGEAEERRSQVIDVSSGVARQLRHLVDLLVQREVAFRIGEVALGVGEVTLGVGEVGGCERLLRLWGWRGHFGEWSD